MEIFQDILKAVPLHGEVRVEVFHNEDIGHNEALMDETGQNTVHDNLMEAIAANLRATSGSDTTTHLSPWGTSSVYAAYPSYMGTMRGNFDGTANGSVAEWISSHPHVAKAGIFVNAGQDTGGKSGSDSATTVASTTHMLALINSASSSVSSNAFTHIGQATYKGNFTAFGDLSTLGTTASSGMQNFYLGKNLTVAADDASAFGTKWASYQSSAFSLDVDDVVKATWTITIG